jgi:hypothetical protein
MANEQGDQGGGGASGAGQDIQRQFNEALSKLSGPGEQLVVLGAILLVFVDVLADIILDEWSVSDLMLVPAWFVIAAVIMHRFRGATLPIRYGLLLAVLGFISGFLGVREVIWGLENNIFDFDGPDIIFELIVWAGGILMLLGALQLWNTSSEA